MKEKWLKVYSSSDAHKVSLVKAILADNDIPAVVINKQDSMNHYLNTAVEISLLVKDKNFLRAKHLISKIDNA